MSAHLLLAVASLALGAEGALDDRFAQVCSDAGPQADEAVQECQRGTMALQVGESFAAARSFLRAEALRPLPAWRFNAAIALLKAGCEREALERFRLVERAAADDAGLARRASDFVDALAMRERRITGLKTCPDLVPTKPARLWAPLALGASGAATVGALYFGARALGATSDWRAATTQPAWYDGRDRARSNAHAANALWVTAGAFLLTGLALYLFTDF